MSNTDGPGEETIMQEAPPSRRSTPSRAPERHEAPTADRGRGGDRTQRLPFIQTNGKIAYIYDHDISVVVSVTTDKHGACLILRIRGGEDVWITDIDRHRWLLGMATNIDTAETLTRRGRPR